uniref:N-acetyltransferase domain-containing protein n=1 Tax=Phlebotomus papatasi TaxID=29031 RepID=A0A1B0DNF1_PHLPP
MKWKRPETVEFPRVWWRFKAKDPESGQTVDYRIEDLTEDRYDEVVDLMINCFVPDEIMSKSIGTADDKVSMAEMRGFWKESMPNKLTLVCYKEGSTEICGLNILEVVEESSTSADDLSAIKGKCFRQIFSVLLLLKKKADVYGRYKVDKYLHGLGLLTLPKYRGCGIATELLKARFPLMKAMDLSLTCTLFSGPGSQGAARKAGFTDDIVVTYESLGKDEPFVTFPNISWPVVKFQCYYLK